MMTLFNPLLVPANIGNARRRDPESGADFAQCPTAGSSFSNFSNNFPRQLRSWIFLPLLVGGPESSFGDFVIGIIKVASQKQMGRVYANLIVALVKGEHSAWNRPKVNDPRSSLCRKHKAAPAARSYNPVAVGSWATDPLVAAAKALAMRWDWSGVVYLSVESFWKGCVQSLRGKVCGTNVWLHSISLFDCLPSLRLFLQRGGNSI